MEKADGPVGCNEGERHQGVVHQGEPGQWAKSVISSTWLIVITSGISPGASSFGLSFGPL